jgi:hypothetical protein
MKRRRWDEAELAQRAKGDAQKVAIAVRLRAESAVTVQWIAERLQMGAAGYVHHLLYRQRKAKGEWVANIDSGELTGVFQQGFILSIISGTDLVVIASR